MCGVSVRMMSVCCDSLRLLANSRPIRREVAEAGHAGQDGALFVADQAGEHVGLAVLQPDGRGDLRVAEGRQPGGAPVPLPVMLLSSIFSVSDTSSSWCVRGVMSMLTPTFS